ncbi:MAG: M48 family metalloprotease [Deltaproteobacteria bacterium]|nr:M48 family metalloprotease [Deltaproteobacteria bacterium]
MVRKFLYVFLLILGFTGCASRLPAEIPLLKPMSEDDEVRISREFRREAKKKLKLVHQLEVERYVDRIGRRLLSVMGPPSFDYRFFVVEDSQLNAFAVPGGSIYVHTGLIERVKGTDELAGVLGHELVHVKSRHMARISGPDPLSILALLGVFLSGGGAQAQAAGVLGQALSATRQLSYSRQLEQEADTLGVKYMAEAGYDPRAALGFLKIIDQERILNPVDLPPYLMTHPLTQERVTRVEAVVHSLGIGALRPEESDSIKKIQTLLRLERHEADAVIGEYERLLGQNPQNAEALYMLGLAYEYKSRWPEAQQFLERARTLKPKSPGIDRELGHLYTQIGEFRSAHEALDRALSTDPKEPLNYLWLGELFEKESNFPEAVAAFLRAHNLSPLWPEPPQHLGVVYGKMNRLGDAHYYLARSHGLADEDELAIANLERALKIFGPTTPRGQLIKDELAAIRARRK